MTRQAKLYGKSHRTVLKKKAVDFLDGRDHFAGDDYFADLTFGGGGHSLEILSTFPNSKVIATDWDQEAWINAKKLIREHSLEEKLFVENSNFRFFPECVQKKYPLVFKQGFQGILMDLGVSTHQLEESRRGFSFQRDAPLDMRMNTDDGQITKTAYDIVNTYSQERLEKLLRDYGEERFARRISKRIVEVREKKPIATTLELEAVIFHCYPSSLRFRKHHPATLTFQALRIEVNDELGALSDSIPLLFDMLAPKGRLVVISFHSLEDRIVKRTYKKFAKENKGEIITKKPIRPDEDEIHKNYRARSAKLRVIQKL